jgi:hypothetical protein
VSSCGRVGAARRPSAKKCDDAKAQAHPLLEGGDFSRSTEFRHGSVSHPRAWPRWLRPEELNFPSWDRVAGITAHVVPTEAGNDDGRFVHLVCRVSREVKQEKFPPVARDFDLRMLAVIIDADPKTEFWNGSSLNRKKL